MSPAPIAILLEPEDTPYAVLPVGSVLKNEAYTLFMFNIPITLNEICKIFKRLIHVFCLTLLVAVVDEVVLFLLTFSATAT